MRLQGLPERSLGFLQVAGTEVLHAELPLGPRDAFRGLLGPFAGGNRLLQIGNRARMITAQALQSRQPAMGI